MMFKVGDKVRCNSIEGVINPSIRVGDIYTVAKTNTSGVELEEIKGAVQFLKSRFELVEEVKQITQQEVINDINMFKAITSELCNTYQRKNADYGNSFTEQFNEYGMISSCIRLEDKLRRTKQLTKGVAKVEDEKLEDTLLDMANYAIMTVIELRKQHNTQEE